MKTYKHAVEDREDEEGEQWAPTRVIALSICAMLFISGACALILRQSMVSWEPNLVLQHIDVCRGYCVKNTTSNVFTDKGYMCVPSDECRRQFSHHAVCCRSSAPRPSRRGGRHDELRLGGGSFLSEGSTALLRPE